MLYFSWLENHADNVGVGGSSPSSTTIYKQGPKRDRLAVVWYETSSGHTLEIAKNITGENVNSPAYEYAIAA